MASGQPIPQPAHRPAPSAGNAFQAFSPPARGELKSWWNDRFGRGRREKEEDKVYGPGIFGIPLAESILYANVAISLTGANGETFIYGYVPIVVAKCGVYLKEQATDIEGIFRLSGSAKRIKDLQTIFNTPDKYGKGLDWSGYTVHDAANVLRRYLNLLPEPIVPLRLYDDFRAPLRAYQTRISSLPQPQEMKSLHTHTVQAYQQLIRELPGLNQQLLLYILDLLAVFDAKSDQNRMTAQNLATIFQPCILNHPSHDMAPNEYRLSQDVLIFLIDNQDNFIIGMTGTGMSAAGINEVKIGPPSLKTSRTAAKSGLSRSASNASAGTGSLGGLRRNASSASHTSRDRSSPGVTTPGTPSSPATLTPSGGGSMKRSNTVPSKRSPALIGSRFTRTGDVEEPSTPTTKIPATIPGSPPDALPGRSDEQAEGRSVQSPQQSLHPLDTRQARAYTEVQSAVPMLASARDFTPPNAPASRSGEAVRSSASPKPTTRERKISNLFPKSPLFGPSDNKPRPQDPAQRQPRKLQKHRIPGTAHDSAHNSNTALQNEGSQTNTAVLAPTGVMAESMASTAQEDDLYTAPQPQYTQTTAMGSPHARDQRTSSGTLMPPVHSSPTPSLHSRNSYTEPSDIEGLDDPAINTNKKRHGFRIPGQRAESPLAPPPVLGQLPGARTSHSSLGSNKPRKSFTGDSGWSQHDASTQGGRAPSTVGSGSGTRDSTDLLGSPSLEPQEKRGLFSRIRNKFGGKDSDADRAKSPQRMQASEAGSRSSLNAFAHEYLSPRNRSFDGQRPREESLPALVEQPRAEQMAAQQGMGPIPQRFMPPVPGQQVSPVQNQASAESTVERPSTAQSQVLRPRTPQTTISTTQPIHESVAHNPTNVHTQTIATDNLYVAQPQHSVPLQTHEGSMASIPMQAQVAQADQVGSADLTLVSSYEAGKEDQVGSVDEETSPTTVIHRKVEKGMPGPQPGTGAE